MRETNSAVRNNLSMLIIILINDQSVMSDFIHELLSESNQGFFPQACQCF